MDGAIACAGMRSDAREGKSAVLESSDREDLVGPSEEIIDVLMQAGAELQILANRGGDLRALVNLIERFDHLRGMLGLARLREPEIMAHALSEVLSEILCEMGPDPAAALDLVNRGFVALRHSMEAMAGDSMAAPVQYEGYEEILKQAQDLLSIRLPALEEEDSEGEMAGEECASTGLPEPFDDVELYKEFVFETNEHLETMEGKILRLEKNPGDRELINEIFRPIHSVKGSAGFLNLIGIGRLAHDMETLLDLCRKGRLTVTGRVVDLCLQSCDCLKLMVANLGRAAEAGGPATEGIEKIVFGPVRQAILDYLEQAENSAPPAAEPALTKSEPGKSKRAKRIGELLVEQGDITADQLNQALDLQEAPLGEILVKTGAVSSDRLEKVLGKQREQAGIAANLARTIKVDTGKIDQLVNLVSELVIIKAQIQQMIPAFANDQTMERKISQLDQITMELQNRSVALRMTPLRPTFQKMQRLVRDAGLKVNKKVSLLVTGEDAELDKAVVEQMGDPLVHLIRNAIDHGIESPEERIAQGKPETGTVNLDAYYEGSQIIIRVCDDGKGLDLPKIWQKAVENGLVDQGENPTRDEICRFIFAPGLTTVSAATDISGRGVGLDVVKKNVDILRGRVEIETEPGKGSVFTITLPLALAVIDGQLVRFAEDTAKPTRRGPSFRQPLHAAQ